MVLVFSVLFTYQLVFKNLFTSTNGHSLSNTTIKSLHLSVCLCLCLSVFLLFITCVCFTYQLVFKYLFTSTNGHSLSTTTIKALHLSVCLSVYLSLCFITLCLIIRHLLVLVLSVHLCKQLACASFITFEISFIFIFLASDT